MTEPKTFTETEKCPSCPALMGAEGHIWVTEGYYSVHGTEHVVASGKAEVRAFDQAKVRAFDQAKVRAFDQAKVRAYGTAEVRAFEQAEVWVYNHATVRAYGKATVRAPDRNMTEPKTLTESDIAVLLAEVERLQGDVRSKQNVLDAALKELNRMDALAKMLADALHFTQEYVGPQMLPALEGWSWFDALAAYEAQQGSR